MTLSTMTIKLRREFKSKKEMTGWINLSGYSHLENHDDEFAKPLKWGLFKWNDKSFYPIENAISIHDKEVWHNELVCRPLIYM